MRLLELCGDLRVARNAQGAEESPEKAPAIGSAIDMVSDDSDYDSEDVEDEYDPVYFDLWVASAA